MKEHITDISLTSVTKIFRLGIRKRKVGVQDVTFGVPRGEVVGLLGPNGSGKSTTIKMILGFLRPTSGEISVCGHRAEERTARQFIGYLPENPRFQKFLTANEVLLYFGHLVGLRGKALHARTEELLEKVGLKHARDERVQGFSKGMTQRLAIAQSLLNRPSILIFDEPMSGLDPLGRMEIRKLIWQIHEDMPEATIFFSTHILGDIEELCSHVALLRKGRLTTFCNIEELLINETQRYEVVVRDLAPAAKEKILHGSEAKTTPLGVAITLNGTDELIDSLAEFKAMGVKVVGVSSRRKSLEEALFSEKEISPRENAESRVEGLR